MSSPQHRANTDDVEKRWSDPASFRKAAGYATVVIVVAAAAFAWYATHDRYSIGWAMATPAVLLAGGIGAMGQTYVQWRARKPWPMWQGAGWFLLSLGLLALAVPTMGLNRPV